MSRPPESLLWPLLYAGGTLVAGLVLHRLLVGHLLPGAMVVGENRLGYRYSRKIALPLLLIILLTAARLLLIAFPAWEGRTAIYFTIGFVFLWAIVLIESVRYLVIEYLLEHHYSISIPVLIVDIAAVIVYFFIAVTVLSVAFQIPVVPLLTTSTVLSIVLGLALQDTLGNLFAGIALQLDHPFRLGDWIEFAGSDGQRLAGRVVEITWRSTILASLTDERIIVPNKSMSSLTVFNYSHPLARILRYQYLHLPRHLPPTRVKEVVLEVVHHVPGVLSEPAPLVDIREYEGGLIKYIIIYWIDDFPNRLTIAGHIYEQLWYQFKRRDIELPLPPRQLYLSRRPPEEQETPAEPPLRTRMEALRKVDFLGVLGKEALTYITEHMDSALYGAGEILFEQGAEDYNLYIIESGEVVITLRNENGRPTVRGRLGPGGFFGEISLLTGTKKSATISFACDTQLFIIRKEIFDHIFTSNPDACQQMSRVITGRGALNTAGQPFVTSLQLKADTGDLAGEEEAEHHNLFLQAIKSFFGLG